MQLNKLIQRDYTSFSPYYQLKLPLDLEISIPSDDPVRLVSAFVEEMDLSELYKTYSRIRKNQATPCQMLKLVIYAAMNRSIQAEGSFADVKEDMNFRRYLYGGKANALAESILVAMGRNINKLHCKIQGGRTGSHLFSLKNGIEITTISMPLGHKAGLPLSKKNLLMRQP